MFWNSVDEHTLDVIEADDTPISSPKVNGLHRVKFHNGQRYSVTLKTDQGKAGDAFWMRAEMNSLCMPYTTPDFANVTLAVLRYIDEDPSSEPSTQLPTTQDWRDVLGSDCRDIDTSALVPLVKEEVPTIVSQQGIFNTQFQVKNTTEGPPLAAFFVNDVTFRHKWYRPVLYDVVEGRGVDNSSIASLTFSNPGAADIIINNLDRGIDHPYHRTQSDCPSLDALKLTVLCVQYMRSSSGLLPRDLEHLPPKHTGISISTL